MDEQSLIKNLQRVPRRPAAFTEHRKDYWEVIVFEQDRKSEVSTLHSGRVGWHIIVTDERVILEKFRLTKEHEQMTLLDGYEKLSPSLLTMAQDYVKRHWFK